MVYTMTVFADTTFCWPGHTFASSIITMTSPLFTIVQVSPVKNPYFHQICVNKGTESGEQFK